MAEGFPEKGKFQSLRSLVVRFLLLQMVGQLELKIDFLISRRCNSDVRSKRMQSWKNNGGVIIIGYRMFQSIQTTEGFHEAFINPGADLVVCDEGHLLKNQTSSLSLAINKVRTLRRIILTGTPLQNNLKECKSVRRIYRKLEPDVKTFFQTFLWWSS